MGKNKNNDNFIQGINFDIEKYSKDKETIANTIGISILNRMQSAFKWNGLPETIPQKWLELQLMSQGFSFITKVGDDLYAFTGGLGGEPDVYYQPTICVVANPALKFNKTCKIGTDGVLINNDTMRVGLIPLIGKYAGLLTENTITMRIADIMARTTNIISASDDNTLESVKTYLKELEKGTLGVIQQNPFLNEDDLKVQPAASSTGTRITDLIEVEQYLKASMYNELGLQANYDMKRESINSNEAQLNDDVLQPLIDNMLAERKNACKELNKLFGTNISVELNSAWYDNELERELALDNLEGDDDNVIEEHLPDKRTNSDNEGEGDTGKPSDSVAPASDE